MQRNIYFTEDETMDTVQEEREIYDPTPKLTDEASEYMADGPGLKGLRELWKEEDGMGTVEVILIIVVLVGLVVIFRDQITKIVKSLFSKITSETDSF